MKKVVSVILSVLIMMTFQNAAMADSGLSLEEVEKLLTDYTWTFKESHNASQNSSYFYDFAQTLHLPDENVHLSEDGSGDIYIAVYSAGLRYTAPGNVTFSADRNEMVIIVENAYTAEWNVYVKQ